MRALTDWLLELPGLRNVHPGYTTVLVTFEPRPEIYQETERKIRQLLNLLPYAEPALGGAPATRVDIPVCYGGEFGPDLDDVARHNRLAPADVVEIHSSAEYRVCFLGFSPGFPYLSGMPQRIATPRLESPRARVPAGSVAIGGAQTGVYPMASPGGWRLIGRTPLRLFDLQRDPPALLAMGDAVRFLPVSKEEFDQRLARG